jgi:hypothetical protein
MERIIDFDEASQFRGLEPQIKFKGETRNDSDGPLKDRLSISGKETMKFEDRLFSEVGGQK